MKIVLSDINKSMTDAWKTEFSGYSNIDIVNDSIFNVKSDAIISPANSFGIMDGGIDGKLRDYFGLSIETAVRTKIKQAYQGELPVGCAIVLPTGNKQFPYLISAPTMRVPEEVSKSLNAYLAMRAILITALANKEISTLAVPGLCALSGRMPYEIVARQMRVAWDKIIIGSIQYSHWREEKQLQSYLKCETDILPYDLEGNARM